MCFQILVASGWSNSQIGIFTSGALQRAACGRAARALANPPGGIQQPCRGCEIQSNCVSAGLWTFHCCNITMRWDKSLVLWTPGQFPGVWRMLSLSPLAPICANGEWRRENLSTLMEAPGACCVLRFTFLIITGIYVSVTIQLGSWTSFSTTGSINFLNFSAFRKSGIECLGAKVGASSTVTLVWGVRHSLMWFCGHPRWALPLWCGDCAAAQLQKRCSWCPQSWGSCPVTHLSPCWITQGRFGG